MLLNTFLPIRLSTSYHIFRFLWVYISFEIHIPSPLYNRISPQVSLTLYSYHISIFPFPMPLLSLPYFFLQINTPAPSLTSQYLV